MLVVVAQHRQGLAVVAFGEEQFAGDLGLAAEPAGRIGVRGPQLAQPRIVGAGRGDVALTGGGDGAHGQQARSQELGPGEPGVEAGQAPGDLHGRLETLGHHGAQIAVPGVELGHVRARGQAVVDGGQAAGQGRVAQADGQMGHVVDAVEVGPGIGLVGQVDLGLLERLGAALQVVDLHQGVADSLPQAGLGGGGVGVVDRDQVLGVEQLLQRGAGLLFLDHDGGLGAGRIDPHEPVGIGGGDARQFRPDLAVAEIVEALQLVDPRHGLVAAVALGPGPGLEHAVEMFEAVVVGLVHQHERDVLEAAQGLGPPGPAGGLAEALQVGEAGGVGPALDGAGQALGADVGGGCGGGEGRQGPQAQGDEGGQPHTQIGHPAFLAMRRV